MAAPSPPDALALHAASSAEALRALGADARGLTAAEAAARLARFGPNALPRARPAGPLALVARQFLSPLIYVLLAAAIVSLGLGHLSDAGFIVAVLALNAAIGAVQERAAERSADALRQMVVSRARVVREGADLEIDAEELVPGDLVRVEGGFRVPADLRLLSAVALEADEALLTGESLPVEKRVDPPVARDAPVADRCTMLFAGTLVTRGHAAGVVTATGPSTELGRIAAAVARPSGVKPPLLVRMDRFARRIAVAVACACGLVAAVTLARGASVGEVFLLAVALAVSAIPEGLPVALTIALAIGARRMARRKVIARRLVAVEALGSCTFVASDKTGTLTLNQLTARAVQLPGSPVWSITGEGIEPAGGALGMHDGFAATARLDRLCSAAALCNEAFLARRDGEWVHQGDAVDVALLVLARKLGVSRGAAEAARPRVAEIPFEAERQFCATLHGGPGRRAALVKGAVERLLPMCDWMATAGGDVPLAARALTHDAEALAAAGHRVIAVAEGTAEVAPEDFGVADLHGLVFLGLIGMIDPLRPRARAAVQACRDAGIEVAMVTGDHPATALAIARELELASSPAEVVSGAQLAAAASGGPDRLGSLVTAARVFARVDPSQKLDIVRALQRLGHFVAVTGDGANDAPALRNANIGVAMGLRGTDVARESAQLVLADDDFESIVAGVEEGRIAYANVRKVVFLLVSTGAAEVVLFLLAVIAGLPAPLLPVQLLWLNLVTNGLQDVALAFEPAEGGEMSVPPRPPREPVFDRVMLVRVSISAAAMATLAFVAYGWGWRAGWDLDRLRNGILLMMVLFENVQVGNARSERRPLLGLHPMRNPLLLFGTAAAFGLHVLAMHALPLSSILRLQPGGTTEWTAAIGAAVVLAVVVEVEKAVRRRRARGPRRAAGPASSAPG